jgi:hypothetical protein
MTLLAAFSIAARPRGTYASSAPARQAGSSARLTLALVNT